MFGDKNNLCWSTNGWYRKCIIQEYYNNYLRRNFDDLECNIDELYPHLKKIKKIILKDIEDGNMTLNELCDFIEEEEAKYYS